MKPLPHAATSLAAALCALFAGVGCAGPPSAAADAGGSAPPDAAPAEVAITATVTSTRFVTREHMLAAGEMQISGEPFAEAMGRDLTLYSRDRVPPDLYFSDRSLSATWRIDIPGFSTAVESYEYSKQAMNTLAFESGAGTSLVYGPLIDPDGAGGSAATARLAAEVEHLAAASHALGRFVFPAGTFPTGNPSGDVNPGGAGTGAENPLGWPGIWPTDHVFASFDPTIDPTGAIALACAISSDDDPGSGGAFNCADYECDASSLHLRDRAAQVDATITPGADGFSAWKYSLWILNYLQAMHAVNETAVATVPEAQLGSVGVPDNEVAGADDTGTPAVAGTFLGSSDIEGFQAGMMILELDNRAEDWLTHLTTADGATLSGFADIGAALAYGDSSPLRWFPGRTSVSEGDDGSGFPRPAYTLQSPDSDLLDLAGLAMGYAEIYAVTDTANTDVGGAQAARAYFDGDPFPADDGRADGEPTLHDRALAMMRVSLVDLDRLHTDPASGLLVDCVSMAGATPRRGTTVSTVSVAYTLLALRTVLRSLSSQLELYSNNTPDTAVLRTPLDALPLDAPGHPSLTFTERLQQIERSEAALLLDHLTTAAGRAFDGWNVAAGAPTDDRDLLDAHTAAIRGLLSAYLATGDVRYRDRAMAVFDRMQRVFYDPAARIYAAVPAPVASVEYTPLRFALLQSALRDVYELVAARPGGGALAQMIEQRVGRLNKLVLNGWDDRNRDRKVEWPDECVDVVNGLPRGGLQMAERTLTGEIGSLLATTGPFRIQTSDRDSDCVPEIDDAHLPAALADSITFHIARR